MIQLAINYSPPASQLFAEGKIPLQRFKCPDWPDMIDDAIQELPVAVHFNLFAGRGKLEKTDWSLVSRLLKQTGTPYVNVHLEARASDFPDIPPESDAPADVERIAERMLADLQVVTRRFGAERVIAENVPYRQGDKLLRASVDPDLIRRVITESGAGLLLDLSHASISAATLGMDEKEYFRRLPVKRLREMHFTGIHNLQGRLQDHLSALPADWERLDWALEQVHTSEWGPPWMLAFEYGGIGEKFASRSEPRVMLEQLPILYSKLQAVRRTRLTTPEN